MSLLCPAAAPARDLAIAGAARDVRLVELDDGVLAEVLERGVTIKATPAGAAVLCTADATYDLKTVETTNALLLVPEGEPATTPARVAAAAGSHVELVRAPARFEALDEALDGAAYGPRHHGSDGSAAAAAAADPPLPPPLTHARLLALVPASEAELRRELAARRVVAVAGGGLRSLDPSYFASLIDAAVAAAGAAGWPLDALPTSSLVDALVEDGFDRIIAAAGVAALIGAAPPADAPPGTLPPLPPTAAAHAPTLRVHAARKLLDGRREWDEPSFVAAWKDCLPPSIATDAAALTATLAGEAVVLPAPPPSAHPGAAPPTATVVALRASALPRDPAARFAALFAARPRWTRAELAPYLEAPDGWAPPPGATVASLLLAHARAAQARAGDETYYSQR